MRRHLPPMQLPRPVTLKRLVRARDQLHASLHEGVSLAELAKQAHMSPSYFLRAFRQVFGETPHAYLINLRLEHSRRVLARGGSITEACFESGYSSVGSYSALFARRFGLSPKRWQQRVRCLVQAPELWPAVWIPGCFLIAHYPGDLSQPLPPLASSSARVISEKTGAMGSG